jgi:hypothetical protein
MKKKWEAKYIENQRNEKFNEEDYDQTIEEVAKIIYSDICQLSIIQFHDSFMQEEQFFQRTGTDG